MNLHINILYYLSFTIIYFPITTSIRNKDLVVSETGVERISPCSVGLQLFSVLNNTSDEDFYVELLSDECCINTDESLDCESLEIIGESSEVIPKGKVKKFTLVAPVLDPFERKGYCVIHVDSRPVNKHNNIMRDTTQIDFDTRLDEQKDIIDSEETIKKCKNKDEDPLNDCKPVNCDTHYNGKKPVYDKNIKRCIEAPKCDDKSSGTKVYDPILNRCINSEPINTEDIDFVKSLNKRRQPKDVIIVESNDKYPDPYNATVVDYSSKTNSMKSFVTYPNKTGTIVENPYVCGGIVRYLTANKYTLLVLGIVIFVQCCLIFTMIYCLTKKSISCDKKKVERKYFNYRQDVSVTTPLIGTSNMDTETARFDYISESSNLDQKVKCYKACQKERKYDTKISMSEDILSKCLNRRDWSSKPKLDINYDITKFYDNKIVPDAETTATKLSQKEITIPEKPSSVKIEDKDEEKQSSRKELEDYTATIRKDEEDGTESDSSEKLIQCHNYHCRQSRRNIGDERFEKNKNTASISTEKGAQACLTNDSLDDFLSERGITLFAGETLSKYSFATNSTSSLQLSGKTSKNNIVKNVLSYLSRKSKAGTKSDPGAKLSQNKDLELLHMSRASVCSSSASEFKNLRVDKVVKD